MNEIEEFQRPYQKIKTVQDLQEQNLLIDIFASHWKLKFKTMPIFPVSNAHFTQMKDFKRAAGERAAELIEHYFCMRDEWFIKQAYSLDCLVKNLNKVNASYSQRAAIRSTGLQLQIKLYCDCCHASMDVVIPLNTDLDKPIKCNECEKIDAPLRHTTKEERTRAIIKFGEAFVDIKKESPGYGVTEG